MLSNIPSLAEKVRLHCSGPGVSNFSCTPLVTVCSDVTSARFDRGHLTAPTPTGTITSVISMCDVIRRLYHWQYTPQQPVLVGHLRCSWRILDHDTVYARLAILRDHRCAGRADRRVDMLDHTLHCLRRKPSLLWSNLGTEISLEAALQLSEADNSRLARHEDLRCRTGFLLRDFVCSLGCAGNDEPYLHGTQGERTLNLLCSHERSSSCFTHL